MNTPLRALVIAEESVATTLERLLCDAHHADVRCAPNAARAIDALLDWTPDVVLADFDVGDAPMSSGEPSSRPVALDLAPLVSAWRARSPERSPVIALEPADGGTPADLLNELGVVSVLRAPVSPHALVSAFEGAVGFVPRRVRASLSRPLRVLLVDDDTSTKRFLPRCAQSIGDLEFREAEEGVEARRIVVEWSADVVVTDLLHPGESGLEIIETLRASAATRELPIVVSSGVAEAHDAQLRALGVAERFSKPVDRTMFRCALMRAMGFAPSEGLVNLPAIKSV